MTRTEKQLCQKSRLRSRMSSRDLDTSLYSHRAAPPTTRLYNFWGLSYTGASPIIRKKALFLAKAGAAGAWERKHVVPSRNCGVEQVADASKPICALENFRLHVHVQNTERKY